MFLGAALPGAGPAVLRRPGAGFADGELLHPGSDHFGDDLGGPLQLAGVKRVFNLAGVDLQPVQGALADAPLEDVSFQNPPDLRAERLESLLRNLPPNHRLGVTPAQLAQDVERGVSAAAGDVPEVEVV